MESSSSSLRSSLCLYGTLIAVSLISKFQSMTEIALNPMQFVSEDWMRDCYPYASNSTITALQSTTRATFYLGSALGTILTSLLPDLIGRQKCLLLCSALIILAAGVTVSSIFLYTFPAYVIGRLLNGIANGHGGGVATLFINEISPVEVRGRLVATLHSTCCIGDFVGVAIGIPQVLGTAHRWPYTFVIAGLMAVISLVVLLFTPDSPRHLAVTRQNPAAAAKALRHFRAGISEKRIATELAEMEREAYLTKSSTQLSIWTLITTKTYRYRINESASSSPLDQFKYVDALYRKALLLTSIVSLTTVVTATIPICSYTTAIMVQSGVVKETAQLATLIMTLMYPISSVLGATVIERTGRKPMLLGGMLAAIASLAAYSALALGWQLTADDGFSLATAFALATYAFGYPMAANCRWTIPAELHPQSSRSAAVAFTDALSWVTIVLSVFVFLIWMDVSGPVFLFLPFILGTLFTAAVLWHYLPETSGKPVEEIAKQLGLFEPGAKSNFVIDVEDKCNETLLSN